jgi:acyl dehydratase
LSPSRNKEEEMTKPRFLDDFQVGETFLTEGITITDSEIIRFAMQFDPQSFHMDATAAAKSPYGGLIASGFHTLSLCFRMFIQKGVLAACSIGSPGIDEVRWLAPVRPGDTLRTETEVLEVKPSSSRPDRGIARIRYTGINQEGEKVITFILNHLLLRQTA